MNSTLNSDVQADPARRAKLVAIAPDATDLASKLLQIASAALDALPAADLLGNPNQTPP